MQERMQMQVKVLQDSLGGDHLQSEEVMKQLLELPALMDDTDIQRISNLIIELEKTRLNRVFYMSFRMVQ